MSKAEPKKEKRGGGRGREARLAPQLSQRRKTNRLTEREREDERKPKTDSKMRTVRPGHGSGGEWREKAGTARQLVTFGAWHFVKRETETRINANVI